MLPAAKPVIRRLAASLLPRHRTGDFAQALMDLGATICSPKRPACVLCPWEGVCSARARGEQEMFPRKLPKAEGKLRRGAAFVALRADGRVLLRRRPEKGLLASMMEVPGSEWKHDFDKGRARRSAPRLGGGTRWRAGAGRSPAPLHSFSTRTDCLCGARPTRDGSTERCAMGQDRRSGR